MKNLTGESNLEIQLASLEQRFHSVEDAFKCQNPIPRYVQEGDSYIPNPEYSDAPFAEVFIPHRCYDLP